MRFKLRAGAGGSGPFGRYWRDLLVLLLLLVRLLLASGVVVESAVFSSAEEIVSGRVGAGQSDGIAGRRERDAEIRSVVSRRCAAVVRRRHVAGAVRRWIGAVVLLLVLERFAGRGKPGQLMAAGPAAASGWRRGSHWCGDGSVVVDRRRAGRRGSGCSGGGGGCGRSSGSRIISPAIPVVGRPAGRVVVGAGLARIVVRRSIRRRRRRLSCTDRIRPYKKKNSMKSKIRSQTFQIPYQFLSDRAIWAGNWTRPNGSINKRCEGAKDIYIFYNFDTSYNLDCRFLLFLSLSSPSVEVVNRLGGLSKWNNIGLSYNPPRLLLLLATTPTAITTATTTLYHLASLLFLENNDDDDGLGLAKKCVGI